MSAQGLKSQDAPLSHPYTCNSCQVAFRNSDSQRGHMRCDWHRYNLKRRVISLPPISYELFTEKVLQAQAHTNEAASKASFEKTCTACDRKYLSKNAFQNHLASQRHKAKLTSAGTNEVDNLSIMSSTFSLGESVTNVKESEINNDEINYTDNRFKGLNLNCQKTVAPPPPVLQAISKHNPLKTELSPPITNQEGDGKIDLSRCLFCNRSSETLDLNTFHMEKIHGLFLPERQFLVDLEGLITYLYQKIQKHHKCLYCGKQKPSVYGIQTHMRDKGHCNIPFLSEAEQLEVGDFYDFTSTYSDCENEYDSDCSSNVQHSNRNSKLSSDREANSHTVNVNVTDADDGWETDGSEPVLDSKIFPNPISHQNENIGTVIYHNKSIDEIHESYNHRHRCIVSHDDNELYLPSGRIAGHRSMNKYFKQNLHNYPSLLENPERLRVKAITSYSGEENDMAVALCNGKGRLKTLSTHKSIDGRIVGITAEKINQVVALEIRSRKIEGRCSRRKEWLISKQKNSQKHFRDPLLQ